MHNEQWWNTIFSSLLWKKKKEQRSRSKMDVFFDHDRHHNQHDQRNDHDHPLYLGIMGTEFLYMFGTQLSPP